VFMDPASFGQIFLIWMLLFVTLKNCVISKSKVCNVLSNLNGSIIGFNLFPMFLANVNEKRHQSCFWWKKLRQYTRWDLVETNVWRTTLEIKDWKFMLHYIISFKAFKNLVLELIPFLQSSCLNLIKP